MKRITIAALSAALITGGGLASISPAVAEEVPPPAPTVHCGVSGIWTAGPTAKNRYTSLQTWTRTRAIGVQVCAVATDRRKTHHRVHVVLISGSESIAASGGNRAQVLDTYATSESVHAYGWVSTHAQLWVPAYEAA